MHNIIKSSSDDSTKLLQFSCHSMFVISDYDFQSDGSEGTSSEIPLKFVSTSPVNPSIYPYPFLD